MGDGMNKVVNVVGSRALLRLLRQCEGGCLGACVYAARCKWLRMRLIVIIIIIT